MKFHTVFDNGKIATLEALKNAEEIPWSPHASFPGVQLKHLVKGEVTGGRLSCHIVRVEAGCSLLEHIHEGKMELHEIMEGSGTCDLNGKKLEYFPGMMTVIPENMKHRVDAGKDGLTILAKFIPALL